MFSLGELGKQSSPLGRAGDMARALPGAISKDVGRIACHEAGGVAEAMPMPLWAQVVTADGPFSCEQPWLF